MSDTPNIDTAGHGPERMPPTENITAKANGAKPVSDVESALDLPNIDNRPSVMVDLKDAFITDEESAFGAAEAEIFLNVKFGKPDDFDWIRCHPDSARTRQFRGIQDKKDRGKIYLVKPKVLPLLGHRCKNYLLRQAVTMDGEPFLWPAPLPGLREAPSDAVHLAAQHEAVDRWIRLEWISQNSAYKTHRLTEPSKKEPKWTTETFEELLQRALGGDRVISDDKHPLVQYLLNAKR
jgi:hypothetical protein